MLGAHLFKLLYNYVWFIEYFSFVDKFVICRQLGCFFFGGGLYPEILPYNVEPLQNISSASLLKFPFLYNLQKLLLLCLDLGLKLGHDTSLKQYLNLVMFGRGNDVYFLFCF